jgi:hypothetical protein
MLTDISKSIVSSRSVLRRVVLLFEAVIRTQLKIGNVDLVGVALDSFWSACCNSFLDVENFIKPKNYFINKKINTLQYFNFVKYLKALFFKRYYVNLIEY